MPLSEGHLDWMNHTLQKCNEFGLNISVAILEYGQCQRSCHVQVVLVIDMNDFKTWSRDSAIPGR